MSSPMTWVLLAIAVACIAGQSEARELGSAPSVMQAVEVLPDGTLSSGEEHTSDVSSRNSSDVAVDSAVLLQANSGAQWGIKLPTCPDDLEICCAFFQNWNWGTWTECGQEIMYVGKQLIKKAMELLDYLTDPQKLAKFVYNSPITYKFWQLWDWGKKAIKAFKEAFENVVEGLTKVVMAMVRLVLGLIKIPGCWSLNTQANEWMAFSGGFKGTDCGAMASLKKIAVWTFVTDITGCFGHKSPFPTADAVEFPTPFLTGKETPFCLYHIGPILRQLVDGVIQIAKAIMMLVIDIIVLGLELIDIVAGSLIRGTPLETLVKSGPSLRASAQKLLNGEEPASPEAASATGLLRIGGNTCLDSPQRNVNGGKVHMWTCNANNVNQQWSYNAGSGSIKNVQGKCLHSPARTTRGGRLQMWTCDANAINQQWTYDAATYLLRNRFGICVDARQRTVRTVATMWTCNANSISQRWAASFKFATPTYSGQVRIYDGICLDTYQGNVQNGRIQMWACRNGHINQQWSYDPRMGLVRHKRGMCLKALQRTTYGGRVVMATCNEDSLDQQWDYTPATGRLKNRHGLCMDAYQRTRNGAQPRTYYCHTSYVNQRWVASFFPVTTGAAGSVRNKGGFCLNGNPGTSNYGRVRMWTCNGGTSQQWTYDAPTGSVRLKNGICLHASSLTANGAGVFMYACGANPYQMWQFNSETGVLKSRYGLCLDARQRTVNGGQVYMWECTDDKANQEWVVDFLPAQYSSSSLEQSKVANEDEVVKEVEVQEEGDVSASSHISPNSMVFRSMFARELEALEQSQLASADGTSSNVFGDDHAIEASYLEVVKESEEAERLVRILLAQYSQPNSPLEEMAAASLGHSNSSASSQSEEEDDALVHKWVVSMASRMDVDTLLESTVASVLAEQSAGVPNADKLGYYFKVGGSVSCKVNFAKFLWLTSTYSGTFKIPLLAPVSTASGALAFSLGKTAKTKGGKFSIGISMAFSIAAAASLDLFRMWNSYADWLSTTATALTGAMTSMKVCDNWGSDMFALIFAPVNMLGAPCAPLAVLDGKIFKVFGGGAMSPWWSFNIKSPWLVKALASLIGLPADKTPGDALSLTVGWSDFKDTDDAWFFSIGINPKPVIPDPTTTKAPPPPGPLVVGFGVGVGWSWFLGIPCGEATSRSLLATNVRASVRARLAAACTASAALSGCSAATDTSAAAAAQCAQESVSARLQCGAGAHLEVLGHDLQSHPSSAHLVVDKTLWLKFPGEGAGSLPVRVVGGWMSGLSSLRVVDGSPVAGTPTDASDVAGGVRTKMSLEPQSQVHLRAVCLQWDATAAKNAFRPMSGDGHSARVRARQTAVALEAHLQQESGSMDPAEERRLASWVQFVKEYDSSKPAEAGVEQRVSVSMENPHQLSAAKAVVGATATSTAGMHTSVERCFKIRIAGVRAQLEATVSHEKMEDAQMGTTLSTQLHSFSIASLDRKQAEAMAESSSLVHAVSEVVSSFEEASVAAPQVQVAMRAAIATEILAGAEAVLQRELCTSLGAILCPGCNAQQALSHNGDEDESSVHVHHASAWSAQCAQSSKVA